MQRLPTQCNLTRAIIGTYDEGGGGVTVFVYCQGFIELKYLSAGIIALVYTISVKCTKSIWSIITMIARSSSCLQDTAMYCITVMFVHR